MTKDKKEQFISTNDKQRKFIKDNKITIAIDHDKVNEIAKRLLEKDVDLKVKVIESKEDIITVIDKSKLD